MDYALAVSQWWLQARTQPASESGCGFERREVYHCKQRSANQGDQ
jgi:hypothetical protein